MKNSSLLAKIAQSLGIQVAPTRPSWEAILLAGCYLFARRSIDPRTQHGAILVDGKHRIVATGYNGPISGSADAQIPLEPPEKYNHMIHAEENLLLSYSEGQLQNSTIFVTGRPCYRCFRMIVQKGINRIIYGNVKTVSASDEEKIAIDKIKKYKNLPDDYDIKASPEILAEARQLLLDAANVISVYENQKEKQNESQKQ